MELSRREFLGWCTKTLGILALVSGAGRQGWADSGMSAAAELPTRPLGRTGWKVTLLGLGGEGVLRTTGRMREAVPVIRRALELGINYFDTAPAYQQSQDYLGEGLQGERSRIFLTSKTHDRSRAGSLRLLEDSLRRLKTDHLDLWQLHDLREMEELDQIFARDGAIRAMEEARAQGMVRFFGITGHTAPDVLIEAARRYPFDTALVAINPADRVRLSFIEEFLPVATEKGMGVVAMKVMAWGLLLKDPVRFSPEEALGYALSQSVSTAIVGCSSPQEVEQNVAAVSRTQRLSSGQLSELEERVRPSAGQYSYFKRH